jgi:hypothetical protein
VSAYEIKRSDEDIDKVLGHAIDAKDKGTAYRGMSYEDGVEAGIEWVTGLGDDEAPLP